MKNTAWTTAADIGERVRRMWTRGDLLRSQLGDDRFPLRLPLCRPNARDLSDRFAEVREWIRALEQGSKARRGFGYDIVWSEVNHRVVGANRVPANVLVATSDDALRLIGTHRSAERFSNDVEATFAAFPELRGWVARRPHVVVQHAADWERILNVLGWFRQYPRPGVYLRQIDVPGVDTKFIESHKGLLAELLDVVLPAESIDVDSRGSRLFERRYGLRSKPALVRFRILDGRPLFGPFSDLTVPFDEFASVKPDVDHVFVAENETNGLAFPAVRRGIAIFGLGYGVENLARVQWLSSKRLHYWGDIDTHGFAILDRLRGLLPHATSLLMDRKTLELHRGLWVREPAPHTETLEHLMPEEGSLYDDLRADRLGVGVRLEQERVAFGCVARAVVQCVTTPQSFDV